MSDQNINPDDIPPITMHDPSSHVRLGRDYIGEQQEADFREDRPWTIYALLGILIMVLIVLTIKYFM